MANVHFKADVFLASELCQIDDYTGEVIGEAKRTKYSVQITVECKSSEGDIRVGSTVYAEMPIAKVAGLSKDQRRRSAAHAAAVSAMERLSRVGTWELYGYERIHLFGDEPLPVPTSSDLEGDIQISESLATHFRKATKLREEVGQALERAKDYLKNGLGYAQHDPSGLSRAARYIADCMRADGSPMMAGWNAEKSAVLLAYVAELIKRRNPNHPNYQLRVSWVDGMLYKVHCPSYWASYPPQPDLLDLA